MCCAVKLKHGDINIFWSARHGGIMQGSVHALHFLKKLVADVFKFSNLKSNLYSLVDNVFSFLTYMGYELSLELDTIKSIVDILLYDVIYLSILP